MESSDSLVDCEGDDEEIGVGMGGRMGGAGGGADAILLKQSSTARSLVHRNDYAASTHEKKRINGNNSVSKGGVKLPLQNSLATLRYFSVKHLETC